jgi:molybdate transport system substrate-binding protein
MQLTWLKRLLAAVLISSSGFAIAGDLTVSAASSLTNAFKEITQSYQRQYPDANIGLNFAASGALLQQLAKGAPVDVFAAADQETMDMAEKQGLITAGDRHDFARNSLVVIEPNDTKLTTKLTTNLSTKLSIKRLEDLGQAGIKRVAIANPASVPVGRYTKRALEAANLWNSIEAKSIGTQNVRQSLDYVARGEVDAGFVYATDAAIMKDKVKVAFEVPLDVAIHYPIASTMISTNKEEARRFVRFILAPEGQAILHKYGFSKP